MGFLDHLPTLASRSTPDLQKSAQPSRLAAKDARDKDDEKKLKVWRDEVIDRDEHKCRCCGVRVVRTISLHRRRAECHHVAGRDEKSVRWDSRAGLLVCAICHEQITGAVKKKILVIGTVFFQKEGKRFINCDYPV